MDTAQKMDMKTITMIVYGCWAAGVLSNLLHFFGVLPLVGLIIAVIKRKEAAGTIYESHLLWVIRSFIIGIIAACAALVMMIIPPLGMLAMGAVGIWALYRLIKGALKLMDGKPIDNVKAFI